MVAEACMAAALAGSMAVHGAELLIFARARGKISRMSRN